MQSSNSCIFVLRWQFLKGEHVTIKRDLLIENGSENSSMFSSTIRIFIFTSTSFPWQKQNYSSLLGCDTHLVLLFSPMTSLKKFLKWKKSGRHEQHQQQQHFIKRLWNVPMVKKKRQINPVRLANALLQVWQSDRWPSSLIRVRKMEEIRALVTTLPICRRCAPSRTWPVLTRWLDLSPWK